MVASTLNNSPTKNVAALALPVAAAKRSRTTKIKLGNVYATPPNKTEIIPRLPSQGNTRIDAAKTIAACNSIAFNTYPLLTQRATTIAPGRITVNAKPRKIKHAEP